LVMGQSLLRWHDSYIGLNTEHGKSCKEVETIILSRGDKFKLDSKASLYICHNVPGNRKAGTKILSILKDKNIPRLFILSKDANIQYLSKLERDFQFKTIRGQYDDVVPDINSSFLYFNIEGDVKDRVSEYPPVQIPFGDLKISPNLIPFMKQKVNGINTDKPLFVFDNQEKNKAYFFGEGLWRWRMYEYRKSQSTEAFDQIIGKSIQLLSIKTDKRKFRVETNAKEYSDNEKVIFTISSYNDLYEPIFGNTVKLNLTSEEGYSKQFSFRPTQYDQTLSLHGLPPGHYSYTAKTEVLSKQLSEKGEFYVFKTEKEAQTLKADHQLLKALATKKRRGFLY